MKLRNIKTLFLAFVLSLTTSSLLIAAPVDINTANAQQIASSLTGIGPTKAAAIVSYRSENGPFLRVEELLDVKGIGTATVEKIRADVQIVATDNAGEDRAK